MAPYPWESLKIIFSVFHRYCKTQLIVDFEECYDKLFQKKHGFYRLVISHVVRKYLECGDLREGLDVSQARFIGPYKMS